MTFIPPREVPFSLFFFKSLSGIGIGILGMLVLLSFVLLGLDTFGEGAVSGPFLTFAAVVMGFITAIATNSLGIFVFGILDRDKYADIRGVMKHVVSLNIFIFLFLLPVYFLAIVVPEENLRSVILVATIQLVASALASMLVLELSNSQSTRQNIIAVYGVIFSVLATIVVNILIYQLGQSVSSPAELATVGSGGKGITIVLFSILPTTWLFFGAFTTIVEMVYRWIYQTWGQDPLNE